MPVMSMQSDLSWMDLFRQGKYKESSKAIRRALSKSSDENDYVKNICLENNLFVCDQLSRDWDSEHEAQVSCTWSASFLKISSAHRHIRCQALSFVLPIDVVLCTTFNFMWWSIMKINSPLQIDCRREVLHGAVFSLKAAQKSCGNSCLVGHPRGMIEEEFIQVAESSIHCLSKLSPIQCQLVLEIISLGLLLMIQDIDHDDDVETVYFEHVIDLIVENLPQMKEHFLSAGLPNQSSQSNPDLIKFGWLDIAEVLCNKGISSVSEAFLTAAAIWFLRRKAKEKNGNILKAFECLDKIDKSNLMYSFLYHYLYAFASFQMGNYDTCLYHLQCTSRSKSNFFMQGRSKTLRGQALLMQGKAAAALEVLQSVEYKRKEVQIPLCPFLMSKAYENLGESKQQMEILELLLKCLSTGQILKPSLLSPLSGMEHCLLLKLYCQPEVSYKEVLRSSASAHLFTKPKEAAEKFIKLLHLTTIEMGDEDITCTNNQTLWELSELFHDTASVLLKADNAEDAHEVCLHALHLYTKFNLGTSNVSYFSSLPEDVIALILLAEAKYSLGFSDVSDTLNRCETLLQDLLNRRKNSENKTDETLKLTKVFLARVYLFKAMVNARRTFNDDAVACFQRSISWNGENPDILLQFARFLLDTDKLEESLALYSMYKDCKYTYKETNNVTFDYLCRGKMSSDEKEQILGRLESLVPL